MTSRSSKTYGVSNLANRVIGMSLFQEACFYTFYFLGGESKIRLRTSNWDIR